MARKPAKRRSSRQQDPAQRETGRSFPSRPAWSCYLLLALSAIVGIAIAAALHRPWISLPWIALLVAWGGFFYSDRDVESGTRDSWRPPITELLAVIGAAAAVRWFKISEIPLGPSTDEIFTLNNSIDLLRQPFDLFGQTPLVVEGWVETANLYLYFNTLIVKLFGVSYESMKLFSVLPGIAASGVLYLIGRRMFDGRVAFWLALLFAFAHWPVG